jgi:hypothetical protein
MSKLTITVLVLLTVLGGGGAIGIVWLRMDISDVAARCGVLEDEREVLSREVQELRGQRSWALRPSTLASMVEGRLFMPSSSQTIHVSRDDMARKLSGYQKKGIVASSGGNRGNISGRIR